MLSTRAGGLWWGHVPGYGDKGPCITHTDNNSKQQQTFVFRTHRDETPEFSGNKQVTWLSSVQMIYSNVEISIQ